MSSTWAVHPGDTRASLARLPERSVRCCVTSPPYFGLRDYGHDGQIGLEASPAAYIAALVEVFAAVRRVLTDDGTLWVNLGDSYTAHAGNRNGMKGSTINGKNAKTFAGAFGDDRKAKTIGSTGVKPKDLLGIPWRVAFALQADGWYLRSDIIWHKPNPMPESVTDRPTKSHEYLFLLAKSERYFYDADAIREPFATEAREGERSSYKPGSASSMNDGEHQAKGGSFVGLPLNELGRNKRDVWTIATQPYSGAHFATFPEALV